MGMALTQIPIDGLNFVLSRTILLNKIIKLKGKGLWIYKVFEVFCNRHCNAFLKLYETKKRKHSFALLTPCL